MTKHIANEPFIIFGAPDINQQEIDEVIDSLHTGWLGTGPKVARFEKAFADYKKIPVSHAAALNSCTAGLHVSMIAAGLGPGDEVITTAMTFCATINAIIHSGATPILADIDPNTLNIDPASLHNQITQKTRAIVPVHFAGRPCEMSQIMEIARNNDLKVIEDCAHAIETEYHGRKAGTFGNFGCFSFYITKNVAAGEGGMVIAQDEHDIARIKVLSLHGLSHDAWHRFSDKGHQHYTVTEVGFKYNMMDLQAAIGIHQLARIEQNWLRRQEIWQQYQESFAELPVTRPIESAPDTRHAYHLYTLLIDEKRCGVSRDTFLSAMTSEGIGIGVHYLSIPEHPFYQEKYGWHTTDYPHAHRIGQQTVSLPLSPKLTHDDIQRVIQAVHKIINK
jgi:dTDP-4-amino-4,6-dideoxygalactose transaminase